MKMFRLKKLIILIFVAIIISFFLLHKRLSADENASFASKDLENLRLDHGKKPHLELPTPDVVEVHDLFADSKIEDLYQKALDLNFMQKVHNTHLFGMHETDSVLIVIQVHDRSNFLQELISSLKNVKYINKATLVFSLDKFSSDILSVISTIEFCRYLCIFFPYSMQLFPNTFPGEDPNDCPRDISKIDAIAKKCNNADYPDKYGHYREVKFVQTKHHWMWKFHMVFKGLNIFKYSQAPAIFLEEDYYVLPDLIHCALKAEELRSEKCSKCTFISLGNYDSNQAYSANNHVEVLSWVSSKSNMGLVFTRETYNILSEYSDDICDYDDYNWDWSLQAVMKTKLPEKLFTLQFKVTRVYHLGDCGGMHSKKNCDLYTEVQQVRDKTNSLSLFPDYLHVAQDNPSISSLPRQNGGWGDLRDRALCKSYRFLY